MIFCKYMKRRRGIRFHDFRLMRRQMLTRLEYTLPVQAASLTIITKQRQNTTNTAKHTGPFLANQKYGQVVKMTCA
jgi:hypothetical protein